MARKTRNQMKARKRMRKTQRGGIFKYLYNCVAGVCSRKPAGTQPSLADAKAALSSNWSNPVPSPPSSPLPPLVRNSGWGDSPPVSSVPSVPPSVPPPSVSPSSVSPSSVPLPSVSSSSVSPPTQLRNILYLAPPIPPLYVPRGPLDPYPRRRDPPPPPSSPVVIPSNLARSVGNPDNKVLLIKNVTTGNYLNLSQYSSSGRRNISEFSKYYKTGPDGKAPNYIFVFGYILDSKIRVRCFKISFIDYNDGRHEMNLLRTSLDDKPKEDGDSYIPIPDKYDKDYNKLLYLNQFNADSNSFYKEILTMSYNDSANKFTWNDGALWPVNEDIGLAAYERGIKKIANNDLNAAIRRGDEEEAAYIKAAIETQMRNSVGMIVMFKPNEKHSTPLITSMKNPDYVIGEVMNYDATAKTFKIYTFETSCKQHYFFVDATKTFSTVSDDETLFKRNDTACNKNTKHLVNNVRFKERLARDNAEANALRKRRQASFKIFNRDFLDPAGKFTEAARAQRAFKAELKARAEKGRPISLRELYSVGVSSTPELFS